MRSILLSLTQTSFFQETQEKRSREQHQQQQQQSTTTTTTTTTKNNNNIQDDHRDDARREYYSEKRYNRFQRESRHRSPSESSDISTAHGVIDEEFKKKYLRCLAYMKLIERLYENQQESDEDTETTHRRLSRRVCLYFFYRFASMHVDMILHDM